MIYWLDGVINISRHQVGGMSYLIYVFKFEVLCKSSPAEKAVDNVSLQRGKPAIKGISTAGVWTYKNWIWSLSKDWGFQ